LAGQTGLLSSCLTERVNWSMIILDPEGNEYEVKNQVQFAAEHDLRASCLNQVLNRKRYHHKGWHLPGSLVIKILVDPDGYEYKFYSQAEFCREHSLNPIVISQVLSGQVKQYKGWHLPDRDIYHRFISPEGKRYRVRNIAEFARDMNLNVNGLYRLVRNYIHDYCGWRNA